MLLNNRFFLVLILFFSSLQLQARDLPAFADLVEENGKAVVNISTRHNVPTNNPWNQLRKDLGNEFNIPENSPFGELFKRFLGNQGNQGGRPRPQTEPNSLGSGFIISEDGYIITNHHVIAGADEILVRLSDKRELSAKVIGSDKVSDIALLKVDATRLPVVNIGTSEDLRVGEWVLAIGSPFGFDHSATSGIVSAKGRSLPSANYVAFIQTDVAINPGNSGGPLFNLDGEVVGINSQIYSRTGGFMGLSFSIPIEVAMEVVNQIKKSGSVRRGWLGVYIQEITHEIAQSFNLTNPAGALVSQVIDNSPAEKAGLKAGDIILSFNHKKILDSVNLPPLVGRVPVGSDVEIELLRNGSNKTLKVTIESLPSDDNTLVMNNSRPNVISSNRIGLDVAELDVNVKLALGRGVLVTRVDPRSAAAVAGLMKGDVIMQLDRKNVKNVNDFRQQVTKLPVGRMIPVLVHRNGANQFVVMKLTR